MVHTPLQSTSIGLAVAADALLKKMVATGASDLHLSVGSSPSLRIDGRIAKMHEIDPMRPEKLRKLADELMSPEQQKAFDEEGDLDFSYELEGMSRFRINVLKNRGHIGVVIRAVPMQVPGGEELALPLVCRDLALKNRGLVLVTGATGSGKSTTLAAMLDYINTFQERHILTIEDPVEFVHLPKKGIVTQREIGSDCKSFSKALRRAMRQDPDIIAIGELRDLDSISMALTAAETGHLVFGTLHTTSATSTIDRLLDVFSTGGQEQARRQIASSLQGVICQTLLPRIGGGRVPAHEILIATDAVRSMIREGKSAQLHNVLQTGKAQGMMTLEESLIRLVQTGQATREDAMEVANRVEEVEAHATPPDPEPDEAVDEPARA